ncbi:hypothetical protein GCM10018785_47710 [Streptomyces longispororuber]|uniref:Uncharacterized protein n=1 Tax=Streptomyces longispororuber TaxID=68230 RepID=A0A919DR96_9ACTN|nr:hypothetical protein [Streptomyces longispororuber]GHE74023.1 hypothetical protein GCM10018785_47710 [Streptomyces longispororuber]
MTSTSLDRDSLKALFQAAHQVLELPEGQLPEGTWTPEDRSLMISTMRRLRKRIDHATAVKFTVDQKLEPLEVSEIAQSDSTNEVEVSISPRSATAWTQLLNLPVSRMSPRELHLRTGYEMEELRAAIHKFSRLRDD